MTDGVAGESRAAGSIALSDRCTSMDTSISTNLTPSISRADHARESEQVHDQHASGDSGHSHADGPAAVFTQSTGSASAATYDASGRLSASNRASHSPSDGHSAQQHGSV